MKVNVGVSNRHVHITKEDYILLFGNSEFNKVRELNQPGEFSSDKTISIKGKKGQIDNVKILGPFREYTQVEVSKTDCYKLGVNPPVRSSGDLENSESLILIGPNNTITKDNCCILSNRHIHISSKALETYGFAVNELVDVLVNTTKPTLFFNVSFRVSNEAYFELHIDTDDANSVLLRQNDIVDIIKKQ